MSERSRGRAQPKCPGTTSMTRDRLFNLQIKLLPTNEIFPLKKIYSEMQISELKNLAEYATGIPVNMQRLYYLDEGDLLETTDVRSNDIVPGGILHMTVWDMWRTLVEAVAANDIEWVFQLGVTADTDYKTPTSDYMQPNMKQQWIADRAFIALYIAAHRGHIKLCKKLLDAGANVNSRTSLGHSPLHVAAAQGHGTIVDLLLERGADIDAVDKCGETALSAACKFDHKDCERHLFLFRWQQRAKHMKPQEVCDLFAHQYHDSAFPVWLKGCHAQVYYTQILPPGEYEGTGFGAPRHRPHSGVASEPSELSESESSCSDSDSEDDSHYGTSTGRRGGPSLPAIRENRYLVSSAQIRKKKKRDKRKAQEYGRKKSERPKTYEEWLGKIQAVEQVKLDKKKYKEAVKKLAEEDKKRQQEFQDKSYEQWLADKETAKKGGPPPVTIATNPAFTTVVPNATTTTTTTTKKTTTGGANIAQSTGTAVSGKNFIRNVIKKQEEDLAARGMMSYKHWLEQNEGDLLEQIRAGKTPLQKVINQMSY